MSFSFDLLREPWVPCIRMDGTPIELGLRDALTSSHGLRELGGETPLVAGALYRLMLAVLHRVFGPPTYRAWADLRDDGHWDGSRLGAYFCRWREHFDLFHPQHPFYQAPDERVKPKAINSLIQDLAFGNKATLFDHHTDEEGVALTPAQAARAVVASQVFGLAGLAGTPQKFTDGTCARGVLFLALGETLFETLTLNLLRYPDESVMPCSRDDRPAWEMDDPYTPDRIVPKGYLDYLTWQNRRVLLLPEGGPEGVCVRYMTMAPALRLDASVLDPMKHYSVDEKRGPAVLRFTEERALWRDSAALFRLHSKGYRPPWAFDWLARIVDQGYLDRSQTRRYLALGMANNQARVDFYRAERMPLPLDYLDPRKEELVGRLEKALQMAEEVARQLWGATRKLATFILAPEADTPGARQPAREDLDHLTDEWAVERRYWSRLEVPFRQTMEAIPDGPDAALGTWRSVLLRTAWAAFDEVASNLEAGTRALKAVVRARDQLAMGLALALPKEGAA